MENGLKMKSITKRWVLTVLLLDFVVITICELVVAVSMFNYYQNLVIDSAAEYVRDINVLAVCNEEDYRDAARAYAQTFKYRDKIEVQLFNKYGHMEITTNGFASAGIAESATDYTEAVKTGRQASWYGTNDNGEKVLAITSILPNLGNGSNGAYRIIVSMEGIIKSYYVLLLISITVGILTFGLSALTGTFFVKSIVKPVREATATAHKIASGNFDTKLQVKQNDEIGELCDTINYMASELQNANKVKNDFISSVSHELRTPLTAIKGWGETVKMSIGGDDDVVRHGMDVILGEAERLSGLVEELLDFSRIESGIITITPSLSNPLEIVGSVVDMYEEIAKRQKKSIAYIKPEATAKIMADRARIKQVFINVIDNAIKYTDAGGHVVVSVFNEEACVRITISDTGCGIATKDLDHVKEKFYKANNNVRGNGIGLAVADEIIKHHNGLLFVESTEGEGTTVTIVLPTVVEQNDEITEVVFPPEQKG